MHNEAQLRVCSRFKNKNYIEHYVRMTTYDEKIELTEKKCHQKLLIVYFDLF